MALASVILLLTLVLFATSTAFGADFHLGHLIITQNALDDDPWRYSKFLFDAADKAAADIKVT